MNGGGAAPPKDHDPTSTPASNRIRTSQACTQDSPEITEVQHRGIASTRTLTSEQQAVLHGPPPWAEEHELIHAAFVAGMDAEHERSYWEGRDDERAGRLHRRAVEIVHAMTAYPEHPQNGRAS